MKLEFDPAADAAYFEISDTGVAMTKEIEPGINADYDAEGHLVGIEVLSVTSGTLISEIRSREQNRRSGSSTARIVLPMDTSGTLDWQGLRQRVTTLGMRNSN